MNIFCLLMKKILPIPSAPPEQANRSYGALQHLPLLYSAVLTRQSQHDTKADARLPFILHQP